MLQGRPLYDNAADARYFVRPKEWDPILRAITRGLNVMIVGSRGVGKTTLLHQIERVLREDGGTAVFVDATAVDDAGAVVQRLRDRLVGRPAATAGIGASLLTITGDPNPPSAGASRAFYETLTSLNRAEGSVVLLDASSSAEALYPVFGRMRDTVWQLPHRWVVAVDEDDRATALKPPADAFFDAVITLGPPSADELERLLELRDPEASPTTLARVAASAEGNPRRALRALSDAQIHDRDPTATLRGRAQLVEAASRLGRPHGMLMAELLERGQASASDERLQRSLGVSRGRLATLFKQLSDEGLVVAGHERRESAGRPRTVYRPRPEAG